MSAIFGIVRLTGGAVAQSDLAAMENTLGHRGPDGFHSIARGAIGFGHGLLSTTPESEKEVLPFADEHNGHVITADARLDNRGELLDKLTGITEQSPDSQFLLRAYQKWGESCVDYLRGDFAFAIWDERKQGMFVARDPLGCKPFYYHEGAGNFVFASSALAISSVGNVRATVNEGRVGDFLVRQLEGIDKTCTWFNEISRLPPAHSGYYSQNRLTLKCYWQLRPTDLSHLRTEEDLSAAFEELYIDSVKVRHRVGTHVASMLSGGLDSSTVVALSRELLTAKEGPLLRTYSGISNDPTMCPETDSVNKVVSQGGVLPKLISPSDCQVQAGSLEDALGVLEDPFDARWTLLAMMFLHASQDGGRILLSGLDGEFGVGAPTDYVKYPLAEGRWALAWQEARDFSRHYHRGRRSAISVFGRPLVSLATPDFLRTIKRSMLLPRNCRKLVLDGELDDTFARRIDLCGRLKRYQTSRALPPRASIKEWHRHIMQVPYLVAGIERYERLAAYFGLEVRHPLLDVRLLEFSAGLSWEQKVNRGWSKWRLRQTGRGRLPEAVVWREGWEQLGWNFTLAHARSMFSDYDLSPIELRTSLASYLKQSSQGRLPHQWSGCNNQELDLAFGHAILRRWLSSRAGRTC